jgi:hypothetical protein
MVAESLPTEYSITGFSDSETASRMIWMLSASKRCKCVSRAVAMGSERAGSVFRDSSAVDA